MNPPYPKRFRPNEPSSERPWMPPPHRGPIPHQPHIHPSRQSQLPPPPPIAPYHQTHPPPPQPAPYYPPQYPPHPAPYYNAPHPHAQPHAQPQPHPHRNKSSDPRQRHRNNENIYNTHIPTDNNNHAHAPPHTDSSNTNTNTNSTSGTVLDVLHIASDETKNFGSFAVTLSQIYGSRNMDGLPFGGSSNDSIEFDGRIRSQPILSFLPEAIDTPSKKVRVYELMPLASTDKRSYDELVAFFTKHERCPVVDKEYNMGILLYFVPPKLIFKKVDPKMDKKSLKKSKKNKRSSKGHKTNFTELLKLSNNVNLKLSEDKLWMISITSTSKYLMFKQKINDKESHKNSKKILSKKRKRHEADLSDIEISTDEDDESDNDGNGKNKNKKNKNGMDESGSEYDSENEYGRRKVDDIVKSELIIALEKLYNKIGQKLPE